MKNVFLFIAIVAALAACSANTSKKEESKVIIENAALSQAMIDLSSVKSISTLLCQNWENKDDAEQQANSDGSGDMDMPYRSFSFFSDCTVVKNPRGEILFGKWLLNENAKTIKIKYENGKTEDYKINAIGAKDMTLTKSGEESNKLVFVADGMQEKNSTDNPFYRSNNQWRIKPTTAETDEAIKDRLKASMHFYWLFLNDNINRNSNTISFYGLPSCFNWYSGGIGVVNETKLRSNWINTFYNKEQALKAHAIMEHLIMKKYVWDSTQRNWLKQSAPILLQMQDSLK